MVPAIGSPCVQLNNIFLDLEAQVFILQCCLLFGKIYSLNNCIKNLNEHDLQQFGYMGLWGVLGPTVGDYL